MADDVDKASEREELDRAAHIADIQNRKPAAVATGLCLEWSEPVDNGKRWCCADCRDTWQRWNPEA